MSRHERPVRRTTAFACALLLLVVCGVVGGFFAFVGAVVHPVFLWFAGFVFAGGLGIGWWFWRELHRTDKAMERIEDTVILDIAKVSKLRPMAAAQRHPFTAGLWKQIRRGRRAAKRSQEVAR